MSDLQLGLIVFGVVLVAAVWIYNVVGERRARRKAEAAFGDRPPDVLFDQEQRREPTLGAMPAPSDIVEAGEAMASPEHHRPATVHIEPLGGAAQISPRVDSIAVILAERPVEVEHLAPLREALIAFGARVRCEGRVGEQWYPVDEAPRDGWRELRVGLQLASREGALTEDEIERFNQAVADYAASIEAVSQREAPSAAAARAKELDAFCAEADIEVAVNVVGQFGATFSTAKVKSLALEQGLSETASGDLVRFAPDGTPAFVVRRFEDPKAKPSTTYLPGLTFALDLPQVQDAPAVFDEMVRLAQVVGSSLGGQLVDDARRPLSEAGIASIRRTLEGLYQQMEAYGTPAGGALARRLFS